MDQDVLEEGVFFALQEPRHVANPYPLYRRLRSTDPFYWDFVLPGWFLTRYEDVRAALTDSRLTTKNFPFDVSQLHADLQRELLPIGRILSKEVLYNDAPDHDRLRRPLNRAFNPAGFQQLRPKLEAAAHCLLAEAERRGVIDIVSRYSEPFADCMIGELLGLPKADRPHFIKNCELVRQFMLAKRHGHRTVRLAHNAAAALGEVRRQIRPLIAARETTFVDDLIGHSVAANGGNGAVEDEILANCVFFLNAGARNMSAAITNALLTLLRFPNLFSQLSRHSDLIPAAVEELLRYETPVHVAIRGVTKAIEFSGRQVGPNHLLVLLLGAANRDPEKFVNPNRLDFNRPLNYHLSFGVGLHGCVGGWLARFGMTIAIETILARKSVLRLAVQKLRWTPSPLRRTVRSLPVRVNRFSVVRMRAQPAISVVSCPARMITSN